jgi:hypothetical protein
MIPKVSVVLPTHDRAGLVGRAITSVLTQTVSDLELVVVDDGSTDDTATVLAEYAADDPRLRVVRTDGVGAGAARNAGLDAVSSEIVGFLDDDDEWLPEKLELQLRLLEADRNVALVGCHHLLVGGPEEVAYVGPTTWPAPGLLWCNFLGSTSFVLVRRPPSFDPTLPSCQDWDLWVRAAANGCAAIVPEVLCRYATEGADRLTTSTVGRRRGHELFEERHRSEMSSACRAYHRARRRLMAADGPLADAVAVPQILATTPPGVVAILLREIAAARAGASAGDPGRGMRRLAGLLERAA